MTSKEVPRVGLVKAALAGRITNQQGATALRLSGRQFQRLRHRFRHGGAPARGDPALDGGAADSGEGEGFLRDRIRGGHILAARQPPAPEQPQDTGSSAPPWSP